MIVVKYNDILIQERKYYDTLSPSSFPFTKDLAINFCVGT